MMVHTRGLVWLLLLLLCWTHFPRCGLCEDEVYQEDKEHSDEDESNYDEDYLEEEGGTTCHPEEADKCFLPLKENLLCHMITPVGRNCTLRDALDFCLSLQDALGCCEDIVDTSCSVLQGRLTFDVWLAGLKAVHRHLCLREHHLDLVNELLQSSKCWRVKRFVNCVEERANLTHVSDLLTTHLDLLACNRLQVAIGTCNAAAEKNRGRCRGKGQAVLEALVTFFSATSCGLNHTACLAAGSIPGGSSGPAASSVSPPISAGLTGGGGGGGGSSALAVVVTMVVMAVVVAAVAGVLGRRGVITLHPGNLRLRAGSAGEAQAVYDNF